MIKNKKIAEEINQLMIDYGNKINESLLSVQSSCSNEEFVAYRKAAGKIMGEMLLEVMNPIYQEHPDIKPDEIE